MSQRLGDGRGLPSDVVERLERLAVAHELNNVLTVIRTYTHFSRQAPSVEQRSRDLRVVAAAAERGAALTDWLSSLAEQNPRAQDELSAKSFISTIALRLQLMTVPGTNIDVVPSVADLRFLANAPRLEHVVSSLILSANQGSSGAKFTLSFEPRPGRETDAVGKPGRVALVISCSSAASDPCCQDASLPPGEVSNSTALVAELLHTMNGRLTMTRSSQDAVRFEVELPLAPPLVAVPAALTPAAPRVRSTILVVEDEAAIRHAMQRTLKEAGHSVIEAVDGPAAQAVLRELGHTVNLVVCDAVLPRGDGAELFAWVRASFPKTACLLISGRHREAEAKAKELDVPFLGKPFYPAELLSCVRGTLASFAARSRQNRLRSERPVVLIVDDEADLRESFERLLSECDFETHVAKNGLHALSILAERRVDAVIADELMPGLDGLALLDRVQHQFPSCTRILCSTQPASELVVRALEHRRVHRILAKNMHAVALRDEIERAVLQAARSGSEVETT